MTATNSVLQRQRKAARTDTCILGYEQDPIVYRAKWKEIPLDLLSAAMGYKVRVHLSAANMSDPRSWRSNWILFEHIFFQVKLINVFITFIASGAIIITQLLGKK